MRCAFGNARGVSFMSVLAALVIIGLLYLGYFKMQSMTNEVEVGQTAIDASRSVACRTQRQAFDREITMFLQVHPDTPPTLEGLEGSGIRVPSCPEGGTYSLAGQHLECSLHD